MSTLVQHLEQRVESSRRLLQIVLAQGQAISRQDVEAVLARLGEVQAEMGRQGALEREREELLREAAGRLGVSPQRVDLELMLAAAPPGEAERARGLSAELQGLVREVARVHEQNQVLMRQELSFLNHLIRVLSGSPQAGYSPTGWRTGPQLSNVVDLRA